MTSSLLVHFVLFGAGFALVLAGAQVAARQPGWKNLLLGLLWLSVALWQGLTGLEGFLSGDGFIPLLSLAVGSLAYSLTAPLFYLYFYRALIAGGTPRRQDLLFFIPALVLACVLIIQIVFAGGDFNGPDLLQSPGLLIVSYGSSTVMLAYLLLTLYQLQRLSGDLREGLAGFIHILRIFTLAALVLVLLEILHWHIAINAANTVLMIWIFWTQHRYPDVFFVLGREVEKAKYERSRLAGLDQDRVIARLRELMENDRLYRDETLRLNDIAGRLDVTEYQLSEILNAKLGRNLYGFLNEYRTREAARLLRERPAMSTLAVGLEVGFNSNSAFYKAFRKAFGTSPAKYRRR